MAKLAPIFNDAQFINAIPANGAKLFTYAAGSSTKLATYTDEDGLVAQANPIILNSRGEPAQPIWLLEGVKYKFVFAPATDTDPPVSPIRTIDDISGINDTSITIDQWVDSGLLPTYVSTTSFTVAGDQTSLFTNKRRLKSFVTAGIAYSTVLSATFGVLTTVVVVNDSLPLDTGLSNIQVGLLTPDNTSIPSVIESYRATIAATATGTPLWASTAQIQDWTGTPTITDFPDAPRAGVWRVCYPAAGTILTDNANIDVQGDANYTTQSNDKLYVEAITVSTFRVYIERKNGQSVVAQSASRILPITASVAGNALTLTINPTLLDFRATPITSGTVNTRTIGTAISMTVSSGSTLGTANGIASRIAVLAIDNAGTVEVACINLAGGNDLSETGLISTTAEGGAGAADSATVYYSTTARSNVPYRVVGYIESTQAAAGTWATAPSAIQGLGGQVIINTPSSIRVSTDSGFGSTNTAIRTFSVTESSIGNAITYATSATAGASFTINQNGVYAISHTNNFAGLVQMGISLNSTQLTTSILNINQADCIASTTTAGANAPACAAVTLFLKIGDVIRPHCGVSLTSGTSSGETFVITKVN